MILENGIISNIRMIQGRTKTMIFLLDIRAEFKED